MAAAVGQAKPALKVQAAHLASRWAGTRKPSRAWPRPASGRCAAALPTTVGPHRGGCQQGDSGAGRLDFRDHAPGEPVSARCGLARRRAWIDADATGDGDRSGAAVAPAAADPRQPLRSVRRREARRTVRPRAARQIQHTTRSSPCRLQCRAHVGRPLAADRGHRRGHLDREHSVRGNPRLRSAHPRTHRGVRRGSQRPTPRLSNLLPQVAPLVPPAP